MTALGQYVSSFDGLFAVEGVDDKIVPLTPDAQNAFDTVLLEGLAVGFSLTGDADDIDVVAQDAVLFDELVKAVGVAGL